MSDEKGLLLGVSHIMEANRLKTALAKQEVEIFLSHNPQTCKTGCTPTVEVWAKMENLSKIEAFFKAQRKKQS